jgi:hypothetical protein
MTDLVTDRYGVDIRFPVIFIAFLMVCTWYTYSLRSSLDARYKSVCVPYIRSIWPGFSSVCRVSTRKLPQFWLSPLMTVDCSRGLLTCTQMNFSWCWGVVFFYKVWDYARCQIQLNLFANWTWHLLSAMDKRSVLLHILSQNTCSQAMHSSFNRNMGCTTNVIVWIGYELRRRDPLFL